MKQDVIAVDCEANTARLDVLEQHENAEERWWEEEEPHAAAAAQPDDRGVVTALGDARLLQGTQQNATMHTPPHSARGDGSHEAQHPAPQAQDLEQQRLQHLTRPPAFADLLGDSQLVGREPAGGQGLQPISIPHPGTLETAAIPTRGPCSTLAPYQPVGQQQHTDRELMRRMAGESLPSSSPMSPVTLAPQSDLLPHLQAEGLDRGPPGLQQLLGGGSVPQASGAPVGHGAAGVGLGVPHFGSTARGFDGHGGPHRPESTIPQRSTHDVSGGSGGNTVGYTGGAAGANYNVHGWG